jgi:antitoxin component of MazEF toxin-antitoxin module
MQQKIIKTGNSVALTIPASFAHDLGIHVGDNVKTTLQPENGKIIFTFSGAKQLTLSGSYLHLPKEK